MDARERIKARERLEAYLDLFLHPMWGTYVEELEEDIEALNRIDTITTLDGLNYRRGELSMLRQLAGFEAQVRQQLDEMDAEDSLIQNGLEVE